MSSTPDCEVEIGSPFGGAECEESSPEPVQESQQSENLYPFENLAVEFYEEPEDSSSKNEQLIESTLDTVDTPEEGCIQVLCATEMEEDNSLECDPTEPDYSQGSVTDSYDSSILAKALNSSTQNEEIEPNYKEVQKSYIEDFLYSNTSSFDEGSNSNLNSNVDEPKEEQRGSPLARFPKLVKAVEVAEYETLQVLYQLLYQRSAWDTQEILKQHILGFCGFTFSRQSEDYSNREMMLHTQPNEVLVKIASILGLEQIHSLIADMDRSREAVIEAIMCFLCRPSKKTRTGRASHENDSGNSKHLPSKCGCRSLCFKRFTKYEHKRLYEYVNELKEKNLLDNYLLSLLEVKKIVRDPESLQDCKKLKEVYYHYTVKFDTKEVLVCKGGFMALHNVNMSKMNTLQHKLKSWKVVPNIDESQFPPIINDEYKEILKVQEAKAPKKRQRASQAAQPKPVKKAWMSSEDHIRQMEKELNNETPNNEKEMSDTKITETKSDKKSPIKSKDDENSTEEKEKKQLKDFPLVVKSIENASNELLVDVYFLLYLTSVEDDNLKSNILDFTGFTFDQDSEEYDERNEFLQRMTFKIVSDVARSFSLAVLSTKEGTIKNLLAFLSKPEESYLRSTVTMPLSLSDVELDDLGDIGDMSDSDASITCEVVEKKVECIDLISSGEDSDGERKPRKEKKSQEEALKAVDPCTQASSPAVTVPQSTVVYNVPPVETAAEIPTSTSDSTASSGVTRKLRDFETIRKIVNTHPHEYLVDIFELLYLKKHEPVTLRDDILNFTGFTFAMKSAEYVKRKQLLDRMLYNSVRRVYNTLIHNTTEVKVFSKPTMITEIFQFLFKLPDHDTSIRIPIVTKTIVKPQIATPIVKATPIVTIPPPPGLNLPNQSGKLSDLKRVFQRVACFPCEYLVDVHKLLFMTDCDSKVIRQNIFAFKGFSFGPETNDFQQRKMYLEYLTFHSLRKISSVLTTRSVDLRNSTKHELATHLTQVLAEYCNMNLDDASTQAVSNQASQSVTSTSSDSDAVENIVVTPIIDPSITGIPESPEKPPTVTATTKPVIQPLKISIIDTRSVPAPAAKTPGRRKRKSTPTKSAESLEIAPTQFPDINLPEVEQYRQLYGQTLNIYNPSVPTITGIATLNSTSVVSPALTTIVPRTMSFSVVNGYSQPIQVHNAFSTATPIIAPAPPTIITQVPSKKAEIIVPGDLVGDSDGPPAKKAKSGDQNGDVVQDEDEDCDKPLSALVGHPIDSVLKKQIGDIVEQSDLQSITINGVIQKIFGMYPKFDLSYRKEFIKSSLRAILYKLGNGKTDRDTNSPDSSVTTTDGEETTNQPSIQLAMECS